MSLLDALVDYVWLRKDKVSAAQLLEKYQGELTEFHYYLLEEIIFGTDYDSAQKKPSDNN